MRLVTSKAFCGMLLAAAVAAACGGHGASALPRPGAVPHPHGSASPSASAVFKIKIPKKKRHGINPKYVSPSTQSMSIASSGGPTTIANLTPSSPGCVQNTNLVCTVPVAVAPGTVRFTVSSFDQLNATGNMLSTATVTTTIVANQNNQVLITLDGVVASIDLVLAYPTPPEGTATTIPLAVNAMDADGNIIVGPGGYTGPITLTDSDTSGFTALSTTTVGDPSVQVTVAYTGDALPDCDAVFGASASGVAAGAVTEAILTPQSPGSATECPSPTPTDTPSPPPSPSPSPSPAVQHIVLLTMENRSFDSYFGTYPGVNGLPSPGTCNPDPQTLQCVYSFHDTALVNYGGPHSSAATKVDEDNGKLDGFIKSAEQPQSPENADPQPDEVMGYHTCDEIPTYCQYAQSGTLADNAFAPSTSWSTMTHLYMVSGWSAKCSVSGDPMSCTSSNTINAHSSPPPDYAWTDITWLLHANGVSWGYYVYAKGGGGTMLADGGDGEGGLVMPMTNYQTLDLWNPLPGFDDVKIDNETADIQPGTNFTAQAALGTLPAVSWVVPPFLSSDHPSADISNGQTWVRQQVNAVEAGPDAPTTLIVLWWDEWGGFYDHVMPPVVDGQGYGFRVPVILIGPMVRQGYIDHQLLSSDAFLKFIEDNFLGSARLDGNDGRPDSRPDVREDYPGLGDLRNDLVTSLRVRRFHTNAIHRAP